MESSLSPLDQWIDIPTNLDPEVAILLHTKPCHYIASRIWTCQGEALYVTSVSHYKYPYSQKLQIDKMIKEMLEEGIIVPSTNPFSSPIVLMKKNDGT